MKQLVPLHMSSFIESNTGKEAFCYKIFTRVELTQQDWNPCNLQQLLSLSASGCTMDYHIDAETKWSPFCRQHFKCFFSCDQAALWMVQSVRPSVCPSVRPSVTPFWLCSYQRIIMELLPMTKVTSMQKVKVRGQRSR